ncbi:MAG TPA: hypothetical protein DEQ83_05935, partial [Rhodobiaceae bacterium]|nr:hypothetical protein [Rhodobiaceae bacterium]
MPSRRLSKAQGRVLRFPAARFITRKAVCRLPKFLSRPKDKPMHIIVVGGGIIGATTAHACLRHGHEVTLLEAGETLAAGTSFANGGQIAVSESAPWSQPGLPMQML